MTCDIAIKAHHSLGTKNMLCKDLALGQCLGDFISFYQCINTSFIVSFSCASHVTCDVAIKACHILGAVAGESALQRSR